MNTVYVMFTECLGVCLRMWDLFMCVLNLCMSITTIFEDPSWGEIYIAFLNMEILT
jgi:hypothetical protein